MRIIASGMDRALDAILRRVKKVDRAHDIPYLAGYSKDGGTIYIDRHMPRSFNYKGRDIGTDRFLILHEEIEKTLIDHLGLHYLHAPVCFLVTLLDLSQQLRHRILHPRRRHVLRPGEVAV